ncbi:MAG: vWA domain-containing protein, partial [Phycisphaerales bacterium]
MHSLALTFLDPLAGALAAGLAVPALLLLYFLKLRRRPVRVTASFLWQRAAEDLQVNTPFRWLRVSLVLLLQLLALLLLCAAIARPALSDLPPATGRVVVLLDASASMRATDADGASRFDAAKREIAEFLGTLDVGAGRNDERSEVMLIAFAHEPRVLANFTTDRGELAAALDRAGPTDQPGDLEAALAVVDAFAAQSAGDEEGLAPTLVVVSDGQDALARDTLAVSAQEIRYVRVGPPESGDKQNAGVALLSARRDDADPATLRIFARVVNASSQPIEVAPVLEIDAAARRAERITIPGASGASPGERTITLETPAPGRALVTLRLPIADALASDNAASVLVDAPGGVDVILVAPTGSVPGRAAPDVFLREAIEALEPRSLRVMTLGQHDDALASGAPLDADLLIYDRVAPTALPPVPSLSIGAAPSIEGLRLRDPDGEPRATRFLTWRRTDPLLRAVSLAETLVARPRVMTLPEVGAGG